MTAPEEEKEGDLLFPQERREYPRLAVNVTVRYRVLGSSKEDIELAKNLILKKSSGNLKKMKRSIFPLPAF